MSDFIQFPKLVFEEMIAHLRTVYPEEGCGLLSGSEQIISRFYPVENRLHSPTRYEMNPEAQIKAFIDAEERGELIQAVVHSHPNGPDIPSHTDILEATYPELVYVICSFRKKNHPTVRGYWIQNGAVSAVEIRVV
ncbi:MAG: M67 family metallopeptidase [Chloroflexota bacterium]